MKRIDAFLDSLTSGQRFLIGMGLGAAVFCLIWGTWRIL